jgi:hypothetical protein
MDEVRYSAEAHGRDPVVAQLNRAYTAGALVERILRCHPDVDLESLRISQDGDEVTVTGVCPDPPRLPGPSISAWSPAPWELS